jgi:CMP/dCMP kinase
LKKIRIVLNGALGAGKTSVGKMLAELLGVPFISTGDFFRAEAEERGISLDALHELMKTDPSIDLKIDSRIKEYILETDEFVMDSRMAPLFMQELERESFNVYLTVNELVGARRIWEDIKNNPKRLSEKGVASEGEVLINNRKRVESEKIRYKKLYNFDPADPRHHDLSIDTTDPRPPEIVNEITVTINLWRTGNPDSIRQIPSEQVV